MADALNRLLQNLVLRSAKADGVRDYFRAGVIGYGQAVRAGLGGSHSSGVPVPVSQLGGSARPRVETRTKLVVGAAGNVVEQKAKFPVWFDPEADGPTPMCEATAAAADGLRFAVADGATEGWESGRWAARLAAAFAAGPPTPADFPAWLAAARDWAPPAADPEPWYVAEKQAQGSFATLAGLELRRSRKTDGWAWRAVAVGRVHRRLGATPGSGRRREVPLVPPARGPAGRGRTGRRRRPTGG